MAEAPERRRAPRRIAIASVAVLGLMVIAFVVWGSAARPASEEPLDEALRDPRIEVDLEPTITLRAADGDPRQGVVFYPGARVSPEAYVATWAPIVAETDVLVLIPTMPLNLAVFGRSRAAGLMDEHPDIDQWWVGGHSLGGSMAASWLGGPPEQHVVGLVLWASYATEGAGLAERDDLQVLSVTGSRDGLATPQDIRERRGMLPAEAIMIEVEGMNHAQFGRYGEQDGDRSPTIDDDQAQRELTDAHTRVFGIAGDGSDAAVGEAAGS